MLNSAEIYYNSDSIPKSLGNMFGMNIIYSYPEMRYLSEDFD